MITRLEANRYRCFERLGIDMGDFKVIVGANGAGKTTLLDIPNLLGELLKADNIASVFLLRRGEKPARASNLRELIFASRGDDFSLAIEAKLPEAQAHWPTYIRYELRLAVIDDRNLAVMNEYLFVFPETSGPDRASDRLAGDSDINRANWHFILRREYGGPALFCTAPFQGPSVPASKLNIAPNLLAMSSVKYQPDAYPAANWLYQRLTEHAVFLDPVWDGLRAASAPGQGQRVIPSALNLPWLARDVKLMGFDSAASGTDKTTYRSSEFADWVDHVKTALPQIDDIDVKEREDDHYAYFIVRYKGGFSLTSSGLSDGTLRILTLTLLAYVPNPPSLLVIEEPENGIHPQAITAVLQSLSSLYDSQVFVSSHSPLVLADTKLDQLLCAHLSSSGAVDIVAGKQHPHLQAWKGGVSLGSLFAAGVLS